VPHASEPHDPTTRPSKGPSHRHPSLLTRPTLPPQVRVLPWLDPVIDHLGHDPRSRYVEHYWLGVLGPSTTWLLRRLADRLDLEPDGFDLHLVDTATSLGLGMKNGRHSPFMRAIDRSCQFGMARQHGDDELSVRRRMPHVTQGQLKRLPGPVQRAQADWQQPQLHSAGDDAQHKARRLALTLLELGEDVGAAERQLSTWRIEPAVAHQALEWAHSRHAEALAAAHPDPEAA
jgi:hypothetical protein